MIGLIIVGWFVAGVIVGLVSGRFLRRNALRYPPVREEWCCPMTSEEERQLYIAHRRTAAMQPGGLIVSRRA